MEYKLLSYTEAKAAGSTDEDVLDVCDEDGGWREPDECSAVFRMEDGVAVELICSDGAYDCPEDNFLYRHYSPLVAELNKVAKAYNELLEHN